MNPISALIVDDQPENVTLIEIYLKKYFKNITTTFKAFNHDDAIDLFLENRPNILFLDIVLNDDYTAFDILDKYHLGNTKVIIISNHEKYAINALNRDNIVGYLLKPIKLDEFINTVSKTVSYLTKYDNTSEAKPKNLVSDFVAVSSVSKINLIPEQDIISCTAEGNYTIFQTIDNNYTSSKNLMSYQKLLCSKRFFRIHHKYLVNLSYIKEVNKADGYYCIMKNGARFPISKRSQESFNKFIRLKV